MKSLIIIELSKDKELIGGGKSDKYIRYDDLIDLMIKGQKIRFQYPDNDICCKITKYKLPSDVNKILGSLFEYVETSDKSYRHNKYDDIKHLNISEIGIKDSLFDSDYEYDQIKKILAPNLRNHFMFKEHDIEIQQRGGFNFNKHKIKYTNKESDPNLSTICNLYNIDSKYIKQDKLKYYHTIRNSQYRPFNIKPMFDDVTPFDYLMPLEKLSSYHSKNSYYDTLYKKYKKELDDAKKSKMRLNLVDAIESEDRDSIILQYIKCRPKTFVITLWKPAIETLDKIIDFLDQNGNIYYVKTISLSRQGINNLLFWYYDDFTYTERLNFIAKKMEYIDVTDDNNPVCYIMFDNVNDKRLSGQGSDFKKELRTKVMEVSGLDKNKYRGNDLLHVNDYFYQTIEYSQLILNQNSINVINNQSCQAFISNNFSIPNLKMQTMRKVVYSDMSLLEIDRMIIMGGTVFYAYGVRAFNDIDAILIDIEPNESHNLIKYVENMFYDKHNKIYFLDAGIQGSKYWNDEWTRKDTNILNFLHIDTFKDLVLNPKNFFYHQGMKIVSLDYEMIRKLIRNRTEDHVDFLMMNLINSQIIEPYVSLVDNKFVINDKYKSIAGPSDERFPEAKYKILKRRYSEKQIDDVKNTDVFKKFFNN
jgi:hypothetical protein